MTASYKDKYIRVYSSAIEIISQSDALLLAYKDLDLTTWNKLKTNDGRCPILEEEGTNLKRQLVKKYAVALIKRIKEIVGMDLITLNSENPDKLWKLDNVVIMLADSQTPSHEYLFKELMVAIYGISGSIMNFVFSETRSKKELYEILSNIYALNYDLDGLEEKASENEFKELLELYIKDSEDERLPFTLVYFPNN